MERTEWTLGENDAGRRLDRILRRVLKDSSQGAILSALRKGLVRLNGKKAQAGDMTKAGDLLSAASFLLGENSSDKNGSPKKAPRCPYPIVFQNENLLFIDKPAGTPTHGKGSVAETFAPQKTDSLAFVQAPLHRLDKGTSGLLAVSKSAAGARWFCKNIKDHSIKKFYWGITLGDLQKEEEWIDSLDTESGPKSARTIATPLKRGLLDGKKITLVRFQIFTGRKRQIRAQCAARGIPILGDKLFGGALDAPGMAKSGGFYLRSMRMEFPQNELGIPEAIEAQEPQDFLAFFK
ncbi:MAG: RluA family pseudouridine synthase [Treponema sp.]|nr:RluA family pseudouridine synthase [Treponema sp.]